MFAHDFHRMRHGPLTLYLASWEGRPALERLVERLLSQQRRLMWCDSARPHPVTGRWSLLGVDPWLTLRAHGEQIELHTSASTERWHGNPLDALHQVWSRYQVSAASFRSPAGRGAQPHGRAVGLMGWLSYELNRWIEPIAARPTHAADLPELVWWSMRTNVLVDHLQGRSWLVGVVDPHRPFSVARRETLDALEEVAEYLCETPDGSLDADEQQATATSEWPLTDSPLRLEATSAQDEFETMARRVLEYVRAGEIFQANVAQRFTASWSGSPWRLYQALRRINPSPFACFVSSDEGAVVSCSPERLVRVQEGRVDTRPIAGTRPRGGSAVDDAMRGLELLLSEKERAEHLMLVDLARNDLGRLCRPGSMRVNELMVLEEYSHVMHIVSDVSGLLRRGLAPVDVIRAVFPGGTITGCPKVRCMQILRDLEPVARGLYTGSLGWLGFDGAMDLNIAIRTMTLCRDRLSFHVGAGIVADSDPAREYQETLAKAAALIAALRALAPEVSDGSHPA